MREQKSVGGTERPDSYSESDQSKSGVAEGFPANLRDPRHQVLRNEAGGVMGQDESVFNHRDHRRTACTLETAGMTRVLPGSESVNMAHVGFSAGAGSTRTDFRKPVHPVSIPATLAAISTGQGFPVGSPPNLASSKA